MITGTRTCYGVEAQVNLYMGRPHEILPNGSLNTALSNPLIVPFQPTVPTVGMEVIDPYDPEEDTKNIRLSYLCIGNNGHRLISGGGPAYTDEVPHRATDSGAFGLIPFVVRPTDDDLTQLQRAKYRLRKTMMIDGILYAAYYGRVLDLGTTAAETTLTIMVDGEPITSHFSPTVNNLLPTQPAIGAENDGSYVNVSSLTTISLSGDELVALQDACQLVFGNSNLAIISEMLFCHGVEKTITGRYPDSGTQTPVAVAPNTYYDIVGVQVAFHATCFYEAAGFNDGLDIAGDLGTTEPLFGASGG